MERKNLIFTIIAFLVVFGVIIYFVTMPESMVPNGEESQIGETVQVPELNVETDLKQEDLNTNYDTTKASYIHLNGDSISLENSNSEVSNSKVTIKTGGIYYVDGTLNNGQIAIDTSDTEKVYLILNNANITCNDNSPIYVVNADKTIITLQEGTTNTLKDGDSYKFETSTDTEPDATIFSHDDLTINGEGTLNIKANYKDGIACKDDLILNGATINVIAKDDGIRGKDSVTIKDATLNITGVADGIKSTNDTETDKGYIIVESGNIKIAARV